MNENIKKIELLIYKIWDKSEINLIPEVFQKKFLAHQVVSESQNQVIERDHESYKKKVITWRNIFPDWKSNIETIFSHNEKVYVRWEASGTHSRKLEKYEPSFKKITERTSTVYEFENGLVKEYWMQIDRYGLYQQLDRNRS